MCHEPSDHPSTKGQPLLATSYQDQPPGFWAGSISLYKFHLHPPTITQSRGRWKKKEGNYDGKETNAEETTTSLFPSRFQSSELSLISSPSLISSLLCPLPHFTTFLLITSQSFFIARCFPSTFYRSANINLLVPCWAARGKAAKDVQHKSRWQNLTERIVDNVKQWMTHYIQVRIVLIKCRPSNQ